MFDLEQAIADWRRQMYAAGINDPGLLDELESHLCEAMRERVQAGWSESAAFDAAVRQVGQGPTLKLEFARAGGTIHEQLKRLFCALAGIPNYQIATTMNTSNRDIESWWATYLKAAALILPAIVLWVGSCVFVVPKLKVICEASGTIFPGLVMIALALSGILKNHLLIVATAILAALVLLEWRSRRWARYRRVVFGVTAFSMNLLTLILIATLLVFAVMAGANLLQGATAH